MKKNRNLFKYLTLLSIPLAITTFSVIGTTTKLDTKAGDAASVVRKTIYNGALFTDAAFASTLTLTISNNPYYFDNAPTFTSSNSLFIYGVVNFANATDKGAMRDVNNNWSTTYEYVTQSGNPIGPTDMITSFDTPPTLIGEAGLETQLFFSTVIPAFDLSFKSHIHFNKDGDFSDSEKILTRAINTYNIGSSFATITPIFQPAYVFEQNLGTFNTTTNTFSAVSFKVYAPGETMTYLRTFLGAGNAGFSGGIHIDNIDSTGTSLGKYYVDLATPQAPIFSTEDQVITINFGSVVLNGSTNVYQANLFQPNWTTTVGTLPTFQTTAKFAGYVSMKWWPIDYQGTRGDTLAIARLVQPVNVSGVSIVETTETSSPTSKDGAATIKYTADPTLSISTTSITTNVWNRAGYSFSKTTEGTTLPTGEQTIDATNMGMGYFYTSLNLNAKISSQQTSLVLGNQKEITSSVINVIPKAVNTVTFDSLTSPLSINGEIAFDQKQETINGAVKRSELNIEDSYVALFYNGSLVENLDITLPTPLNSLVVVDYQFTYTLTTTQKANISLFTINAVLFYDIIDVATGDVDSTQSLDNNFITDSGDSTIITQIPSNNSGLSVGAIVGIVIGAIAAVGLLAMIIISNRNKKAKKAVNPTKPTTTSPK